MRQRVRVRRVSIVADRGRLSARTRAALASKALDCDYLLGARLRSVKEVRGRGLADRGRSQELPPERKTAQDLSPLKVKAVTLDDRRDVVCLTEEQRRKDAAGRQASVEHWRAPLKRGAKDLLGNKGSRKYLQAGEAEPFTLDEAQIQAEARDDGPWVLQTRLADEPKRSAFA